MQLIKNRSMLCSVTAASQAWPLPGAGGVSVVFQNLGAGQVAYVAFGENNQVVTAVPAAHANLVTEANFQVMGGYPILANASVPTVLTAPRGATHFAAIGSGTLSMIVSQATTP